MKAFRLLCLIDIYYVVFVASLYKVLWSYPSEVAVDEMKPSFFTLAPLSQLRKNLNECQSVTALLFVVQYVSFLNFVRVSCLILSNNKISDFVYTVRAF